MSGNVAEKRAGKVRRAAAGLVVSLLAVTAAQAADEPPHRNRFELTPFFGSMGGGEFEDVATGASRDLKSDTNYGLFFDMNAEGYERQYEMFYTRQSTELDGSPNVDMDTQYLHIGGIVNFTDVGYVVPYFGLTVGATRLEPDAPGLDATTRLSFSVGGGMKIPLTKHVGLRLDGRAYVTLLNTDADLFCASGASGGTCLIRAKSDTFVQYSLGLGVIAGF